MEVGRQLDNQTTKLLINGVSKRFGRAKDEPLSALEDIHISVPDRCFASIVGPSGCGKTTLLRIVAGLVRPTVGTVLIDNEPVRGPSRACGYVPQAYTLFPWLTVEGNIEFGMRLRGWDKQTTSGKVKHLLRLVGLTEYRGFFPKALSGGMQQRVAIARALAVEPEILLLDEPFGALDTQTRAIMQENLLQIWDKTQKTILLVTHDIEEAIFVSDVIYASTARPGRVKAELTIPFERPRSHLVKQSVEFLTIKNELAGLIREESLKAMERAPCIPQNDLTAIR